MERTLFVRFKARRDRGRKTSGRWVSHTAKAILRELDPVALLSFKAGTAWQQRWRRRFNIAPRRKTNCKSKSWEETKPILCRYASSYLRSYSLSPPLPARDARGPISEREARVAQAYAQNTSLCAVTTPRCCCQPTPSLPHVRYFRALRRRLQLPCEQQQQYATSAPTPVPVPYSSHEEVDQAKPISCSHGQAPTDEEIREALRAKPDVWARLAITPEDGVFSFSLRVLRIAREMGLPELPVCVSPVEPAMLPPNVFDSWPRVPFACSVCPEPGASGRQAYASSLLAGGRQAYASGGASEVRQVLAMAARQRRPGKYSATLAPLCSPQHCCIWQAALPRLHPSHTPPPSPLCAMSQARVTHVGS